MHKHAILSGLTALALVVSSSAVAKTVIHGEAKQGALLVGQTDSGNTVVFGDKQLKVSKQGFFAFGFGRDDKETVKLKITDAQGNIEVKELTPKVREYNIQRIEGISKKIMNPNPKAIERSRKDNQQIGAARSKSLDSINFAKGFIVPAKGQITGVYGSQRVYNGVPKRPHFGLDYAGPVGAPVVAPAAGKVTLWVPDMFYSGGTMIIDHGHGVSSTFLHLSASHVKVGDYVEQGQLVADIGKSGRVTGPHLDWRINWFNVRLDPALALNLEKLTTQ